MNIADAVRNAMANAACALANGGSIKIYTGTSPGVGAAATGTLLSTLPLSATAFGAASAGVATANAVTSDSSAAATGTAGYFRVLSSAAAALWDGTVSATGGGGEMQLNSVSIVAGGTVSVTSWTVTQPAS